MKIIPNYSLNFNQKINKQQTNPNFEINKSKVPMFPLGIGAAAQNLMPVQHDTVTFSGNDDELTNLPIDKCGYTELHYLCKNGNIEAVKKFINENPNINLNQQTKNGNTCMSLAVKNKHEDIVKFIASRDNYDPTIPNENGWTDLHSLCEYGYTDVVKTLAEKHSNIDFNQQAKYGDTCMCLAVEFKHADIVNFIANREDYDPTIPDEDGWTDLHSLCKCGYTDVVKTLAEKHPNIDFNQQTKNGNTCMYFAAENKHADIVKFIASREDYDPTIPDEDGWTDLHSLCKCGYTDVVKDLLNKYPDFDINQQTKYGDTCMCLAVEFKHADIVNFIANREDYDPTIPDENGWTDLHNLCKYGYTDVVKDLLNKYPDFDINQQTKNGYTCMSLAKMYHHEDTLDLLRALKG